MTSVKLVYETFFTLITDDMYLTISKEETERDCLGLLLASLPLYEFPTKVIDIVFCDEPHFSRDLTLEEINILALGMVKIWLDRQIQSIEILRQKFTDTGFKQTSQAAHLSKLLDLSSQIKIEHRRLQMLQSRRRRNGDEYESNFDYLVKRMR